MAQAVAGTRNRELSLLILGLIVGGAALALVALAREDGQAAVAAPFITILAVSYIAAHLVIRRFAPRANPLILPLAGVVNALGVTAIFRLSDYERYKDTATAQLTWTLVGIACFIGTLLLVRDAQSLARFKYIFGFAGVGLMLLPLMPGIGREINGAQLWVDMGPINFQPGELAKIALVIFFAGYLAERKELLSIASRRVLGMHVPDIKHFGPLLVMWGLSLAVMFYLKDLGSSLLFFSIFLVMLYIATARLIYVAVGGGLFAIGAYIGYQTFTHVQARVQVWMDVFNPKFVNDEGFQLAQSLFALSSGGLFGTGLGQGRPDLIPAAHTDFVFAVLGQELGLMGAGAIVLCFLLMMGQGFRIAITHRDDFGQLLAAGLTTILGVQTFIILGGVTRLLPLTGITLPFVSYGGSSLLSNFILIALLVRLSDQTASHKPPAHTAEILIGGRR
jgi:cell division protein FtsW (lipid II flippase)